MFRLGGPYDSGADPFYGFSSSAIATCANGETIRFSEFGGSIDMPNGEACAESYGIMLTAYDSIGSGTVTKAYGVYCETPTAGATNVCAYFAGKVGLGTTVPLSALTVKGNVILRNITGDAGTNVEVGYLLGQCRLYGGDEGTGIAKIAFLTDASTWYKGGITFLTNDYDGTDPSHPPLERMRITREGKVGINDTAPAEYLDVTGNINVTGVYKVDDVQVVSSRVVDARIDDVINSGDVTTDGVIDALRDAMIAHGLIAAS
jgi:hypothetical protein